MYVWCANCIVRRIENAYALIYTHLVYKLVSSDEKRLRKVNNMVGHAHLVKTVLVSVAALVLPEYVRSATRNKSDQLLSVLRLNNIYI